MKLEYLGWSAFALTCSSGTKIVIDPFLKGDPILGIPRSPVGRTELYPVDAVVVTHSATDHLGEAFEIVMETDAILVGNVDVRLAALGAGIPPERIVVVVSGVRYVGEDWKVKALAAQHISFSTQNGMYLSGQPLCYVLEGDDVRVFHGGDTSIVSDFDLYGRLYRPDVALLGIGGVLFEGRYPLVELDPREAAIAAQMLGVRLAIPMHYRPDGDDSSEFLATVRALTPSIQALELAPGETIMLEAFSGSGSDSGLV